MTQAVVFKATFRARAYSADDMRELRAAVEPFALVRLRGERPPEAGGSAEIAMVLEFVGTKLAEGAIGWVGAKTVEKVISATCDWWRRKRSRPPHWPPEVTVFRVSLDDTDVTFVAHRRDEGPDTFFLTDEALGGVPNALGIVTGHFDNEYIREHELGYIEVPLVSFDRSEVDYDPALVGMPDRYWKIGLRSAPFATHRYDSATRTVEPLPNWIR